MHQKPCRHEDSLVLFCHVFPLSPGLNTIFLGPLRSPLLRIFIAIGTIHRSFFFLPFHQSFSDEGGKRVFESLLPFSQSFYEWLSAFSIQNWTGQWRQISKDERMNWSCAQTSIWELLLPKHIKSLKTELDKRKRRRFASCFQRLFTKRN